MLTGLFIKDSYSYGEGTRAFEESKRGEKSSGAVPFGIMFAFVFFGLEFLCLWSLWAVTSDRRNLHLMIQ